MNVHQIAEVSTSRVTRSKWLDWVPLPEKRPSPVDSTYGPEETPVRCPKCGFDYSHIINVFTRLGSDPYEAKVYRGTKAVGTVGARRSCLVVVFEGECGHVFEWQIQQHKGNNFVTAEFVRDHQEYDGPQRDTWIDRLRRSLRRVASAYRRHKNRLD